MNKHDPKTVALNELLALRQQIDRLDHGLVLMLANRFALTRRVGEIKASANLSAVDPRREEQKLAEIRALCEQHGLNPELLADILARIMGEAVRSHERIRAEFSNETDNSAPDHSAPSQGIPGVTG